MKKIILLIVILVLFACDPITQNDVKSVSDTDSKEVRCPLPPNYVNYKVSESINYRDLEVFKQISYHKSFADSYISVLKSYCANFDSNGECINVKDEYKMKNVTNTIYGYLFFDELHQEEIKDYEVLYYHTPQYYSEHPNRSILISSLHSIGDGVNAKRIKTKSFNEILKKIKLISDIPEYYGVDGRVVNTTGYQIIYTIKNDKLDDYVVSIRTHSIDEKVMAYIDVIYKGFCENAKYDKQQIAFAYADITDFLIDFEKLTGIYAFE